MLKKYIVFQQTYAFAEDIIKEAKEKQTISDEYNMLFFNENMQLCLPYQEMKVIETFVEPTSVTSLSHFRNLFFKHRTGILALSAKNLMDPLFFSFCEKLIYEGYYLLLIGQKQDTDKIINQYKHFDVVELINSGPL